MRILAVIPTYNERENIVPLLEALLALPHEVSVLVVDDVSPDGTAQAVCDFAARQPGKRIDVLVREGQPRGLGNAYRDGFAQAVAREGDAVLQMDADGQHPVASVLELAKALESGAELAIASRYVSGGGTGEWHAGRKFMSRFGGAVSRVLLSLPYYDLTGGFKLWRRDLLAKMNLSRVEAKGYAFQIEMTLRAHRMGARIVEVPFTFGLRGAGESKMHSGIALEGACKLVKWAVCPPRHSTVQR